MSNEINATPVAASSGRLAGLMRELDDREFRANYMAHRLRTFLADQIRGLRGDMSQTRFGRLIGKPQSVVSRLEDEEYGRITVQTLIDIASRLDIAFLGRFVDFPAFLRATLDVPESSMIPKPYNKNVFTASTIDAPPVPAGALGAFLNMSYEQNQPTSRSVANQAPHFPKQTQDTRSVPVETTGQAA